jgi:hypothetical protein
MPLPKLQFNEHGKGCLTCANCKKVRELAAAPGPAQTRLEHIFEWVMASIRSQGYRDGYLCRKCEKKHGVDTSDIRARCKKVLTPQLFEARRNVKITVT